MSLKKILLLVLSIFLLQQIMLIRPTAAQNQKTRSVIIRSDPPGAMLYFKGENSFIGVTPFNIKPNLTGRYQIMAVKPGYEKSKVEYYFKGTEKGVLRLRLTPKTPFKAGIRSLIFPGWGQRYSERRKMGTFLSLAQAGVGIFTFISHNDYEKAYDEYKSALSDYEQYKKISGLRDQYWDIVVRKHKSANDAFDERQVWLYITGGLWLYNFLDSIFFFPSFDRGVFNKTMPGISANFQNNTFGLTLKVPF